jgi:hypothetical protein
VRLARFVLIFGPARFPQHPSRAGRSNSTMASPLQKSAGRPSKARARVAAGASWAALVAAAALGDSDYSRVHARILTDGKLEIAGSDGSALGTAYRLVVQSYDRASLSPASLPSARAKPLGSLQRAITPEELQRGVGVDLVNWSRGLREGAPVVVAWVEPGTPDLEFDGLRARPPADAWFGAADPEGGESLVVVVRRPAIWSRSPAT